MDWRLHNTPQLELNPTQAPIARLPPKGDPPAFPRLAAPDFVYGSRSGEDRMPRLAMARCRVASVSRETLFSQLEVRYPTVPTHTYPPAYLPSLTLMPLSLPSPTSEEATIQRHGLYVSGPLV